MMIEDISPAHKGDLKYFRKLGVIMKHSEISKEVYAYLQVIAKDYPDFDGNPPSMTTSKQEHIISTLSPLFQFIKDCCFSNNSIFRPDLSVQEFYSKYSTYCEVNKIKP